MQKLYFYRLLYPFIYLYVTTIITTTNHQYYHDNHRYNQAPEKLLAVLGAV